MESEEMVKRSEIQPTLDARVKWQMRALEAEAKLEILELVASCAQDIVEFWPKFTLRQIPAMATKMETLKQALKMLK